MSSNDNNKKKKRKSETEAVELYKDMSCIFIPTPADIYKKLKEDDTIYYKQTDDIIKDHIVPALNKIETRNKLCTTVQLNGNIKEFVIRLIKERMITAGWEVTSRYEQDKCEDILVLDIRVYQRPDSPGGK